MTGSNSAPQTLAREWARRFAPDIAAIVLLLALCLLFFWQIITPNDLNRASFAKGDFSEQFYAFAFYKSGELTAGRLPLWNPYAYGGHAFLADTQSAIFYPLGLLTVCIAAPWGFPLIALEGEAILHFFLASLFTYLLARRILRNRFGSLVAAITFTYGGYLTAYPGQQLSILEVDVWLPLILLFIDLATDSSFRRSKRLLYATFAGFTLALSLLAGHPQSSLFVLYATSAYFLFRIYLKLRDEGVALLSLRWVSALDSFAAFLILGMGLSAVQLLPSYEFARLSTRAEISYDFAAHGFPLRDVLQLVLPGSVSLWSPMYVGILPLLLAVWAIFWGRIRPVAFWVALALSTLLISFGGNTFLYSALYQLAPGFGMFRDWERSIFLFSFAMAMLAGHGATLMGELAEEKAQRSLRWLVWASLAGLALFAAVSYGNAAMGKFEGWIDRSAFLVILLLLISGLLYLQVHRLVSLPVLGGLAVFTVLLDIFTINWKTNVADVKPWEYYRQTPITQRLQADPGLFRVDNEFRLPLNYGCVYGISDLRGSSPLQLKRYKELTSFLPRERVWQLLNVEYILTWEGGRTNGVEHLLTEKGEEGENYLYRLLDWLPRAYIVHSAVVVRDDQATLERLASPDFDPKKTVILAEETLLDLPGAETKASKVDIVRYQPNRIELETDMEENGILVLSENYYPGWKVFIDNSEGEILRADYTLRAVALTKGQHRIVMTFDPLSFKIGAPISAFTLVGWLVFVFSYLGCQFRRSK